MDGRLSREWAESAAAVEAAGGEWVLLRAGVNVCYVTRLRQGRVAAFRPPERYEFRSVRVDPNVDRNWVFLWGRLR